MTANENEVHTLCDIVPGQTAVVKELQTHGAMRRRLIDIGLTEKTRVKCTALALRTSHRKDACEVRRASAVRRPVRVYDTRRRHRHSPRRRGEDFSL